MKNLVFILALVAAGCALKNENAELEGQQKKPFQFTFAPENLTLKRGSTQYVIIDSFELDPGTYDIDTTVKAKGVVEYPALYPEYTETPCEHGGYSTKLIERRKAATNGIVVVPFLNGKEVINEHKTTTMNDKVQVAVYAEYGPLTDFSDHGRLPSEFLKTPLTSWVCTPMCARIRTTPLREMKRAPQEGFAFSCNYFEGKGTGPNGHPAAERTNDFGFSAGVLTVKELRGRYLELYQGCDQVLSNEDLRELYERSARGPCLDNQKLILPQVYFVGHKVEFKTPRYSIENFSDMVRSTGTTQKAALTDRVAHPLSDWR